MKVKWNVNSEKKEVRSENNMHGSCSIQCRCNIIFFLCFVLFLLGLRSWKMLFSCHWMLFLPLTFSKTGKKTLLTSLHFPTTHEKTFSIFRVNIIVISFYIHTDIFLTSFIKLGHTNSICWIQRPLSILLQ